MGMASMDGLAGGWRMGGMRRMLSKRMPMKPAEAQNGSLGVSPCNTGVRRVDAPKGWQE